MIRTVNSKINKTYVGYSYNPEKRLKIHNLNKKYNLSEIVSGDSLFCATGVTSGDLVEGIKINNNNYTSETLVTHKSCNFKKIVKKVNTLTT